MTSIGGSNWNVTDTESFEIYNIKAYYNSEYGCLNGEYTLRKDRKVNGKNTWWRLDSHYLFWCSKYHHWGIGSIDHWTDIKNANDCFQ